MITKLCFTMRRGGGGEKVRDLNLGSTILSITHDHLRLKERASVFVCVCVRAHLCVCIIKKILLNFPTHSVSLPPPHPPPNHTHTQSNQNTNKYNKQQKLYSHSRQTSSHTGGTCNNPWQGSPRLACTLEDRGQGCGSASFHCKMDVPSPLLHSTLLLVAGKILWWLRCLCTGGHSCDCNTIVTGYWRPEARA